METFKNPPITEALIDIRTELASDASIADIEKIYEDIKAAYPKKKSRFRYEGVIEFKEGEIPSAESKDLGPDGILLWSADDKQLVQFRLDGFTFNRLRPYKNWDAMQAEAKPLWDLYVNKMKPLQVTRLALRYINSIDIPAMSVRLEDYFTKPPQIPEGLSQLVEQFLARVVIDFPEIRAKAVITQALQPPRSPNVTSVLFDLDVFRSIRLTPASHEVWDILSELRSLKNNIFDKSITDKTKELFR